MPGRFRREGEEGIIGPEGSVNWHMHSSVIAADSNSFFKDGRRISIGDCALFKPPQDSPPFIGLIRWLSLQEGNDLWLGVNWIYRPAEIKLEKGTLLDSAPNEVFYSFHRDEIHAAFLLHPCKVAFLPRGIELPQGTSSFVCRRVYDIANKCLWCLTDQDYINEWQEEVDQLLFKTRSEMHATLQPGGHSPKQANGPTSTSQMKPGSDSAQNTGNSFPSQARGKKRERGDHGADPVKRERSSRIDDGVSTPYKAESNIRTEVSSISGKGLVDLEGVDKLVQLMQHDKMERKIDFSSRSMLVSVIASTDEVDCLSKFVQVRGLLVLDEWLQDIHKGKIGDGIKDSDKLVEEFLLVLLRALDKLPVNLQALQMCNIGRSVNHLRSHKNMEIQRKARTLVDTWKKSVEAEMIRIDAKSSSGQPVVSWPSKPRLPETFHGIRAPNGSDVAIKSSITQNSVVKTTSHRSSQGENNSIKHESVCYGPVKLASSPSSGKESQVIVSVGGNADAAQFREDRSSSSNHSHSYNQSCSPMEDLKSSLSSAPTTNKTSNSITRNRKITGVSGVCVTGSQKEISSSRGSSAHRSTVEKLSRSASSERLLEGPAGEGNSQKLTVKMPNRVSSPAQVSGRLLDDPTFMNSQISSPVLSDKHEHSDRASQEKIDTNQSNVVLDVSSRQNNVQKSEFTGLEGAGLPAVFPDEEQSMTTGSSKKLEVALANKMEPEKLHASFSPMNALIESCVKYAEATSSFPVEDDVGMNLLASVAAGEMSRSDMVTPTDSAERSRTTTDEVFTGDEAKSKSPLEVQNQSSNGAECDGKKQAALDGCLCSDGSLHLTKHEAPKVSGDRNFAKTYTSENLPAQEGSKDLDSSKMDLPCNADSKLEIDEKPTENIGATSAALPISMQKVLDGALSEEFHDGKDIPTNAVVQSISKCTSGGIEGLVTKGKDCTDYVTADTCNQMVEIATSKPLDEGDHDKFLEEGLDRTINLHPKPIPAIVKSEFAERTNDGKLHQRKCSQKPLSQVDSVAVGVAGKDDKSHVSKSEKLSFNKEVDKSAAAESNSAYGLCSTPSDVKNHCKEAIAVSREIQGTISYLENRLHSSLELDILKDARLTESKFASICADEAGERATNGAETVTTARASGSSAKLTFDLNEGFGADDGKYGESVTLMSSGPETAHMSNSLPFSQNSLRSGPSASITVAAAAKGPFIHHEDLLRSKVEDGWKGSAATSAFRPAEPRKVIEMPNSPTKMSCLEASTSKHDRVPLDFDLNVPDERVVEEMSSQGSMLAVDSTRNCVTMLNESSNTLSSQGFGGLDLDLNRVDETNGNGHYSSNSNQLRGGSMVYVEQLGVLPAVDIQRDFDLNNGPAVDDTGGEQFSISKLVKGGAASQLPSAGPRMNAPGMGSFSSWFSSGDAHSTVAFPSILPERGEHSVPVFPSGAPPRTFVPASVAPFSADVYRGSVLSSSPAVPFPSSPYQLPIFPFGTHFPFPPATFPVGATSYSDSSSGARVFAHPMNSQFLGPFGSAASQFQRPYVVGLPDISSNGGLEGNRKWDRQGLDLNAGPAAMESRNRGEMMPLSSGQHSIVGSQALVEEQARAFSVSGGGTLKGKEPEGGWDGESLRHKQSSWQ